MDFLLPSSRNAPDMPCAFERLGPPGAAQDPELGGAHAFDGLYGMSVEADMGYFDAASHWASPAAA